MSSNQTSLSPAATLLEAASVNQKHLSSSLPFAQKYSLLVLFCLAQFLDTFNGSALFPAIPTLTEVMGIDGGEVTWVISAYQLTFASFLLVSGKVSDVYNPKHAFVFGSFVLAIISLGTGFVNDKIGLIVLRALGGIAGSTTIPSALSMLIHVFPEPTEQARALTLFGSSAAIGNVFGLTIGALFVQYTSQTWRWIFWFLAIVCFTMSALIATLAPTLPAKEAAGKASKLRRLDLPGVSVLTVALILLIFGVTSGTTAGWGTAQVIAPLIISIVGLVAFFVWEARLPADLAAIPSETWFYTNFSVLMGVALLPFMWYTTVFTNFVTLWQEVYHWSVISTALRLLPIGGISLILCFSSPLSRVFEPKYLVLFGHLLLLISTVVLAFTDEPGKYASYAVPAFIIGSSGSMLVFTQINVAIFRTIPASMAGTVGAVFNCAIQVGPAVGLAVALSIQTSVDARSGSEGGMGKGTFKGRAASFWFMLAVIGLEVGSVAMFYRVRQVSGKDSGDKEKVEEVKEDVTLNGEA